jgi:hypothetical protein
MSFTGNIRGDRPQDEPRNPALIPRACNNVIDPIIFGIPHQRSGGVPTRQNGCLHGTGA